MTESRETIQNRILKNIEGRHDKTEGSFIYDVVKPIAIELESINKEIENAVGKLSIENLVGEELEKRVYEKTGITRKPATKASGYVTITGSQGAEIKEGELVAGDIVNFVVKETKTLDSTSQATVLVECEEYGTIGNVFADSIKYIPVTISGIAGVTNSEDFANGYNVESDEELLNRYYDHIRTPATSGNKFHYRNWAKEVPGIGASKVFPLWQGVNGSVRVVVIDSNKRAISEPNLIEDVSSYIEENRPIGAQVTVVSGTEAPVTVNADVRLITGYSIGQIQTTFGEALTEYFKDIAFVETYVSHAIIGNILLSIPGVKDYSDLKINDGISNIDLGEEGTPVLNSVSLNLGV